MNRNVFRYFTLPLLGTVVLGLAHTEQLGVFWDKGMLPAFLIMSLFAGIGAWLEQLARPEREPNTVHSFRDYSKGKLDKAFLTATDAAVLTTANAFLFRILPPPYPYGWFMMTTALCFLSLGFLSRLVFPYFRERQGEQAFWKDMLLVTIPLLLILLPFLGVLFRMR